MSTYDHKISYVFMGSVNICEHMFALYPIDFHTRVRMPPTHRKEFIIFEHPYVVWRPNLANLECPYMITGVHRLCENTPGHLKIRFIEALWRIFEGFMEDLWWIYGGLMEDLWRIYGGFMMDL